MRSLTQISLLLVVLLCSAVSAAWAVPVTNGGPGGMGSTDGSSSLELWLKSDTQTFADAGGTVAATTTVVRWNDLSGNNRHALADIPARAPTLVAGIVNGGPGVSFTGGAINTGSRMTINSVASPTNPYPMTSNETAFFNLDFTPALGCCRGILSGNDSPNRAYAGGSTGMFAGGGADGFSYAGLYRVNSVQTNSVVTGFQTITGFENPTPASNVTLRLGSGHGGNPDFGGRMAEVILFSDAKNQAQQIIVENYLSARHNAGGTVVAIVNNTLGVNDRYAGDLASNGNYDYQVFGLGQTTIGVNHLSGGSGGLGLETSALDDNEWLMAGNSGVTNSIVGYEDNGNPDIAGSRWAKVWNIDKTGSMDATIAFDFEDSGLATPTAGTSFHLLYSADNNFADGWEILDETLTQTNGTVSFNLLNAALLDGYYTLGLNIGFVPEPSSMLLMLGLLGFVAKRRKRA